MTTLAEQNAKLQAMHESLQRIETKQAEINGDLKDVRVDLEKVKAGSKVYKILTPILTGILGVLITFIITNV